MLSVPRIDPDVHTLADALGHGRRIKFTEYNMHGCVLVRDDKRLH